MAIGGDPISRELNLYLVMLPLLACCLLFFSAAAFACCLFAAALAFFGRAAAFACLLLGTRPFLLALQVIQVVWSVVMPDPKLPDRRLLSGPKHCRRTENKN